MIGRKVRILNPYETLQMNFHDKFIGYSTISYIMKHCYPIGMVINEKDETIEVELDWKKKDMNENKLTIWVKTKNSEVI